MTTAIVFFLNSREENIPVFCGPLLLWFCWCGPAIHKWVKCLRSVEFCRIVSVELALTLQLGERRCYIHNVVFETRLTLTESRKTPAYVMVVQSYWHSVVVVRSALRTGYSRVSKTSFGWTWFGNSIQSKSGSREMIWSTCMPWESICLVQ